MVSKIFTFILLFIGGAFYSLGYPNKHFLSHPALHLIGLVFFFKLIIESNQNLKNKIIRTLMFSLGFSLTGLFWIKETVEFYSGLNAISSIALNGLYTLISQPHLIIFVITIHFIPKIFRSKNIEIFLYALLFAVIERISPQLFPVYSGAIWLRYAPYLFMGPIGGVYIYSFFNIIFIQSTLTLLSRRKILISHLVIPIILILSLFFPLEKSLKEDQISIRIVQANISNFEKYYSGKGDLSTLKSIRKTYQKYSLLPSKNKIDLTIWPETSYSPILFSKLMKNNKSILPPVFTRILEEKKSEIIFGGHDRNLKSFNPDFEYIYNTAFFIGIDGILKERYHKENLLVFGETLPFGKWNKNIAQYIDSITLFAKGKKNPIYLKTLGGSRFIPSICYEILFPEVFRSKTIKSKKQIHYLLNITNDSWFGRTSEPEQHLFLATWRAIENGIPLVRSANSGISAFVDQRGITLARAEIGEAKTLDHLLSFPRNPKKTLFARFGIWITVLLTIILMSLVGLKSLFKKIM